MAKKTSKQKKFLVSLHKTVSYYTTIEVSAKNEDEAGEMAYEKYVSAFGSADQSALGWRQDPQEEIEVIEAQEVDEELPRIKREEVIT